MAKASDKDNIKKIDIDSTQSNGDTKKKLYANYSYRLFANLGLFVLFFATSLLFATKTLQREKLDPIKYSQNGDISYKVFLNKNDYYSNDYLDMNKAYIANLIDHVDINFNYLFSIERETTIDFEYKIVGELVIENSSASNRYFEKEYVILDTKNQKITNGRELSINESVVIDYDKYNMLANSFKSDYGIDTNSYLNVYLDVKATGDESLNYKINENSRSSLKIPLSEKAIEINLDKSNQNVTKQVLPSGSVIFNVLFLIAEIIFFVITCVFLARIIKYASLLGKRKTEYDKYVNKLLRDYDRLIVESDTMIDMSDCKIVYVKDFMELLDVRDNLKMPIIYFNVVKHLSGIFYIKNENDVYMVPIKNEDLIDKKEKNT